MNILTKFKDLLIETLKENKKLIIGLYIVFIITFIAAWILSAERAATLAASYTPVNTTSASPISQTGAIELFITNEWGGIVTYVASIFFAIPAIVMLVYNGVNIGSFGQLFNHIVPNGGIKFIVYLIPHGIFEITATVIQSAAGILLFLFIWRFLKAWRSGETQKASDSFEKTKKILIQSLVLMVFATILLIIAAPIEAYFSVPFSEFIVGK